MALPTVGTLQYGEDIEFTELWATHLSARPAYSSDGRTVKWVEHHLRADGYVSYKNPDNNTSSTDTELSSMRKTLNTPGLQLLYTGKGYGDLSVNVNGGAVTDVNWGPKPLLLSYTPIGSDKAAAVSWECVACIPECDSPLYKRGIVEYVYDLNWSLDQDGYNLRAVRGKVVVPLTYWGATNKAGDSADRLREDIAPPVPVGYQRIHQNFNLSADRTTLNFDFQDQEVPAALPDDCTRCDLEERLVPAHSNSMVGVFVNWYYTLSGTITLAQGKPKTDAIKRFLLVLRDRRAKLDRMVLLGDMNANQPRVHGHLQGRRQPGVYLNRLELGNQVFGRDSSFSATLWIVGANIRAVLARSGLWTPVKGTGHGQWKGSLKSTAFHPRGWSNDKFNLNSDIILDLCSSKQKPSPTAPTLTSANLLPKALQLQEGELDGWHGESGDDGGFARWENRIFLDETSNYVFHKPIDEQAPLTKAERIAVAMAAGSPNPSDLKALATATGGTISAEASSVEDLIQRRANPTAWLIMDGGAVRVGKLIPVPRIVSVGGVAAVEVRRFVSNDDVVGAVEGGEVPVYRKTWTIWYRLMQPPKAKLPETLNPAVT